MTRRYSVRAIAAAALVIFAAETANASVQPRSGLPQGLNVGLGLTGASLDLSFGPLAIGGAVAGSTMNFGNIGGTLNPFARLIYTIRNDETLAFGFVLGAAAPLTYPVVTPMIKPATATESASVTYTPPTPARVPIVDVGLTASYHFNLPNYFGVSLPLTVTPTVTFMLDGNNNLTFGPSTNLEAAVRFAPEVELVFGGGTSVGLRFKI